MRRRNLGWILAAAGLTLLLSASAPAFPQGDPGGASPPKDSREGSKTVERILREQEQLLSGQRFSYDPNGRRDPFRSLYESVGLAKKGPRPRGVAGMLIAEVSLVGIVQDPAGGSVAFFTGTDNKGYFLRVGDEVYDGTLIAVDPKQGNATFRQQVDDPRLIKPYRDVVKRLVPPEEGKVDD